MVCIRILYVHNRFLKSKRIIFLCDDMLTRMKSGAHRSLLYGWEPSTFEGCSIVNIILGIADESHPQKPRNPTFPTIICMWGNFPFWPYGECLKFRIFALPHMGKSFSLVAPLFTWETNPLSHVGKASGAPCDSLRGLGHGRCRNYYYYYRSNTNCCFDSIDNSEGMSHWLLLHFLHVLT